MVRGIFLAKIYFTDLSAYKIRPVLVIKALGNDVLCLQLTSKTYKEGIVVTNRDMSHGKLQKESMVVVPKNFTLHKSILTKHIATLKEEIFQKIYRQFCKELACN